jgi:hypothetical protein
MAKSIEIDIFSCPLCNNSVYPIYDHDLKLYNSIACWLKDDIKLQVISRVLSEYAVKLYENNITTVDKLKFKIEQNGRFLLDLGFDDYDAKIIKDRFRAPRASSSSSSSSSSSTPSSPSATSATKPMGTVFRSVGSPPRAPPPVVHSHRELLIRFYKENNGDRWTERRNWCSSAALEDWYGVFVEPRTERVAKIQLSGNNIVGTLPSYWSGISTLTKLDLSDNKLKGPCPPSWSALSKLEVLYMRDNRLSGTLPAAWSAMSALTALDMNGNNLGGLVPREWSALGRLNACILYKNYFGTRQCAVNCTLHLFNYSNLTLACAFTF